MLDFSNRFEGPEIMDHWYGATEEQQDLVHRDILRVNRLLGGDRAIKNELLEELLPSGARSCSILDVGCGDGGLLRYLRQELPLMRPGTSFLFEGWDYNTSMIEKARMDADGSGESIVYRRVDLTQELPSAAFDIVISSLTLHHFSQSQIADLLKALASITRRAILVSDLERSPFSYYLFYVFSRIFLRTPTAKADGLTSIRKGFRPDDFQELESHLPGCAFNLRWVWAFRYHWIVRKS